MARGAMLVLLLAGCSSQSSTPDLAVPDLSPSLCTLVFSGDESGTLACYARFCRSSTSDELQLYSSVIGSFEAVLAVDGTFTPGRAYAAGDLSTFTVDARSNFTTFYGAGTQVAGSTVALTFTGIEPNDNVSCASGNATAHGTARVSLIERLDGDGGTRPPNHVTVDASF